jgi:hypothetical protein
MVCNLIAFFVLFVFLVKMKICHKGIRIRFTDKIQTEDGNT